MSKPIEIITIGDINNDILLVPLPPYDESDNPETLNNDESKQKTLKNNFRQKCLQIKREGGALLIANTIRDALTRNEFNFTHQDTPIIYGYEESKEDQALAAYLKGRKALAMLKLFPRSYDAKDDDQVYRLEKLCGWLSNIQDASSESGDDKNVQ